MEKREPLFDGSKVETRGLCKIGAKRLAVQDFRPMSDFCRQDRPGMDRTAIAA
jgi:hypothetical protein